MIEFIKKYWLTLAISVVSIVVILIVSCLSQRILDKNKELQTENENLKVEKNNLLQGKIEFEKVEKAKDEQRKQEINLIIDNIDTFIKKYQQIIIDTSIELKPLLEKRIKALTSLEESKKFKENFDKLYGGK